MRDIEIFETAKTTGLNQEELWDSAESILYVFDAMCDRLNELRGTQTRHAYSDGGPDRSPDLFRHQKLDAAQQFKIFSCELVSEGDRSCCCVANRRTV